MQESPGSTCWARGVGHVGSNRQFLGSSPDDVYTAIQNRSEDARLVNAPVYQNRKLSDSKQRASIVVGRAPIKCDETVIEGHPLETQRRGALSASC